MTLLRVRVFPFPYNLSVQTAGIFPQRNTAMALFLQYSHLLGTVHSVFQVLINYDGFYQDVLPNPHVVKVRLFGDGQTYTVRIWIKSLVK